MRGILIIGLGLGVFLSGCSGGSQGFPRPTVTECFRDLPPQDSNHLPDIEAVTKVFPELKGILVTASEYSQEERRQTLINRARKDGPLSHRIPAGTQIEIRVHDEPGLTRACYVRPGGSIFYPYIGEIEVRGLTLGEVENSLETKFAKYLKNPQFAVTILEPTEFDAKKERLRSELKIQIAGPGYKRPREQLYKRSEATLAYILGRKNEYAKENACLQEILIIRRDPGDPLRKSRVIIPNVTSGMEMSHRVWLRDGDVIYVPRKGKSTCLDKNMLKVVSKYLGDDIW